MRSAVDLQLYGFLTIVFATANLVRHRLGILTLPRLSLLLLHLLLLGNGPTLFFYKPIGAARHLCAFRQPSFPRPLDEWPLSERSEALYQFRFRELRQLRRLELLFGYGRRRLRPSRWGQYRQLGLHLLGNCWSELARERKWWRFIFEMGAKKTTQDGVRWSCTRTIRLHK